MRISVEIFAKAPVPGLVKTRLAEHLGKANALQWHRHMVQRCLNRISGFDCHSKRLWCSPDCNHGFFQTCQRQYNVLLAEQQGHDLGERMAGAARRGLNDAEGVMVIGTDCPAMDSTYLQSAAEALQNHDVVIGPATDGGYVLLAVKHFFPSLFQNIPWGSADVLKVTRQRLQDLAVNWLELPALHDVDTLNDLEQVVGSMSPPLYRAPL